MVVEKSEIGFLYGDLPLLSMENFTELFLICLAKKDGIYDLSKNTTTVFLPVEFIEKIDDYLHSEYDDIEIFKGLGKVIDLNFYSKNCGIWYDEFLKLLDKTIDEQDCLNKSYDFKNNGVKITYPTSAILNAFGKYDGDLFEAVEGLTKFILNDVELKEDEEDDSYTNAEILLTCLAKNNGLYDLDVDTVVVKMPLELRDVVDDFMHEYDEEKDFFLLNDSVDVTSYFYNSDRWYDNFTGSINNLVKYDKKIEHDYSFYNHEVTYKIPTSRILDNLEKSDPRVLDGISRLADYINNYEEDYEEERDNPSYVRTLTKYI